MSDDCDYMSDIFVNDDPKRDIRPSLNYNHRLQLNHERYKKKMESRLKPKHQIESETREKGLKRPIDETNKGFRLLKKMGFNDTEKMPIEIQLKNDRKGLGFNDAKPIKSRDCNINDVNNINEFRERIAQKNYAALVKDDLRKCQIASQRFDCDEGIEHPIEQWYWQKISDDNSDDDDDDDDDGEKEVNKDDGISDEQKLNVLVNYLREKYFWCVYCAIKFNDYNDMIDNCPNGTRDAH